MRTLPGLGVSYAWRKSAATAGLVAAVGGSMFLSPAVVPALAATARPGVTESWRVVSAPRLAPNNSLAGIAVAGKRLAWAVGGAGFSGDGKVAPRPLLLRWTGRSWSRVRLPGTWRGSIAAVAESSATNAWALGMNASEMKIVHLLHWTGHRWGTKALPHIGGPINADIDLAAAPGGRAWISTDTDALSTLLFDWNGRTWAAQAYPCAHLGCGLIQINARTSKDAWAVGNYFGSTGSGGPLALHWNGRHWSSTPVPFVKDGFLTGVFGVSRTDAWAVGAVQGSSAMLLYHWNGMRWQRMRTPAGLTTPWTGERAQITGDSARHLWIYGFGMINGTRASYLRFNGHRWSVIRDAPVRGENVPFVRGMAVVPGTQTAWSVGVSLTSQGARARIERYGTP
jgi:hypothetical protein